MQTWLAGAVGCTLLLRQPQGPAGLKQLLCSTASCNAESSHCCAGLNADAEMARRLQAQYDREMAEQVVNQPDEASMRRMAGQAFNSAPQPVPSTAQSAASQQPGQGTSERPATGVAPVSYPVIGGASGKPTALSVCFCALELRNKCMLLAAK